MTLILIEDQYAGDDLQLEHDTTGVDTADPIVKAWLTFKTAKSVADPGSLQKVISVSAVQGVGQITEDGSELQGSGTASLVFQCTAAETAALGTAIRYVGDIQVKTASGKVYTSGEIRLLLLADVTDATT